MGKQLTLLALLALAVPWTLAGEEPVWPDAILALERVALSDPRPGTAWLQLRNFAVQNGLEAAWRARWEARIQGQQGAAESILLGWLDLEAGHNAAARTHFEQATAIAPGSYHAWLALAEMQLRAGEAAGGESIHKARSCAADDRQRVEVLRLPAVIEQERGDLAGSWAAWKALDLEPLAPGIRLALTPDFARAHLATGDAQDWAKHLASVSSGSADDAAVESAALLALGDPAGAYRIATTALKWDAAHAGLRRIAIDSACAAGFVSEAAARIEADLGETPDDQALIEALQSFVELGAPDHVLRLCRRHAPRLAPLATSWRALLPGLWRLGVTPELRRIFIPQTAAGGWELSLVLGEMAIMEKDYDGAVEPLWRVLAEEFDRAEISSLSRAEGNSLEIHQSMLTLRGFGIELRLREVRMQSDHDPGFFEPSEISGTEWPVYSLCDGRDLALVYLRRLATRPPGENYDKLHAQLRAQTAHWPPGEKLLAWSIVEGTSGLLDVATEIADRESSAPSLRSLARSQLSRLLLAPGLSREARERLVGLIARFPKPPVGALEHETMGRRWLTPLAQCWDLFDAGKFAEADQAFLNALDGFSRQGLGPSVRDWVQFHSATLCAAGVFVTNGRDLRAEASSYALRWLALQTPRRPDWPAPARPRTLWEGALESGVILPLFPSRRTTPPGHYRAGGNHIFPPISGNLPVDLWPALIYHALHTKGVTIGTNAAALPPESKRLLSMVSVLPSLFRGEMLDDARVVPLERLFATPDGAAARLLGQQAEMVAHLADGDVAPLRRDYIAPQDRLGTIGRASWIVGRMSLVNAQAQVSALEPLVEELLPLPIDAAALQGSRRAIDRLAPDRTMDEKVLLAALAGKVAATHARFGPDPLPAEVEEELKSLMDTVEIDRAVALARQALSGPVARDERLRTSQKVALATLQQCGELPEWLSELRKRAKAGGLADWERLARQCDLIVELIPESPPASRRSAPVPRSGDFGQLDLALRHDALDAGSEAESVLARLQPGKAGRWWRSPESRDERSIDVRTPLIRSR